MNQVSRPLDLDQVTQAIIGAAIVGLIDLRSVSWASAALGCAQAWHNAGPQTAAQAAGFLSAGAIGLCQLNVTVPNVVGDSSGDVPISVMLGGARNAQNLFTTIQP